MRVLSALPLTCVSCELFPYAFIGAVPVLAWGRVRAATDIDVGVLAATGSKRVVDALRQRNAPGCSVPPADSPPRQARAYPP